MTDGAAGSRRIAVGRITGVYGVKGWVKVYSYTEPREQVAGYSPWWLKTPAGTDERRVLAGRQQGSGVVVSLEGITDRDAASALIGAEIEVDRALLGPPPAGQYYWTDLEGMEVDNVQGVRLGVVDHLMATGANDVLVVVGERRHLVPFVPDRVVRQVDPVARRITVDWDEDF